MSTVWHRLALCCLLVPLAPRLSAQERGATALGEAVAGLDATVRVLMIGAHPDDEDTQLITWLARGRQAETGYLSLTRGDGGQNLIGNELGPLLGMIRTEELLAARRLDGGRQFFTRAYDFGFSKTAEETYGHWSRDSILRDVVTVVRGFRPHVIIAVFSGTPRDGHGHHQVSGMLAREVFDAAMDTVRFPAGATLGLGAWSPGKFYRAARFSPAEATLALNVGELSALRGRTYAEIASESRSQHLSQGFGALERRGASLDYLTLEASRVGSSGREQSPLDGIAPAFTRFGAAIITPYGRNALDSLADAVAAVRTAERLAMPAQMIAPLARVLRLATAARDAAWCASAGCEGASSATSERAQVTDDLVATLSTTIHRAQTALLSASGVQMEATSPRELVAVGDSVPVTVTVYNQGRGTVQLLGATAEQGDARESAARGSGLDILPDSAGRLALVVRPRRATLAWWLANGRSGDVFLPPAASSPDTAYIVVGEERVSDLRVRARMRVAGVEFTTDAGPVIHRFADPARGEQRRPLAAVPAINVTLDNEVEYARAGVPFDRSYRVRLGSAVAIARSVAVSLSLPAGLTADTLVRRAMLEPLGSATLTFRVRGTLPAGRHAIEATATADGRSHAAGWLPITYEHIRPLRQYRAARVEVEAVNAALPANRRVAYIAGVGDNVEPMLRQLGLVVTTVTPAQLPSLDLAPFGALVVGPRAFAASRVLVSNASVLQRFARDGGTVVVQYGQAEVQGAGILPYPVTLAGRAQRVTDERASVTVLRPAARLLALPNRITTDDFAGWVQERAVYMPATADARYQRLLEMHDPGEADNAHAVLVAPLGRGAFVYTTLALFRQLPAGVPGAARIFLNLLAADGR